MTHDAERGLAVEVAGLRKRYGAHAALDCVDVRIAAGSLTAILGPSGCGKTTLLKTIAGFERPDEGAVLFDGVDVTDWPPEARGIGLVFQGYALFPHMTVAANIAYPLKARRLDRHEIARRVTDTARAMEIEPLLARKPAEISGGQRQRVAIARAVVFQPRLLLLDEPLSALDRNLRDRMKEELVRLHRRLGITLVIVTHDQDEATELADQIVVMDAGRVIGAGSPRDLYDRPASAAVAQFFGRSTLFAVEGRADGRLLAAGATVPEAAGGGAGTHLLVRPEGFRRADGADEAAVAVVVETIVFRAGRLAVTARHANGATVLAELAASEAEDLAPGVALHLAVAAGWLVTP